jgi:PIN domain nuclease of toxin-antitoxin system
MRLLLDTNALIWWHLYKDRVGYNATRAIRKASVVCVSVLSGVEIAVKKRTGRLDLDDRFVDIVERHGFNKLPLTYGHIADYDNLPMIHKDPFDRLLVAQAVAENMGLVSSDRVLKKYPVSFIDACK